jgi:1,4-alpha-glucan branching enzyme
MAKTEIPAQPAQPPDSELEQVARGQHGDPHRVLGRHGNVVRVYRPDALAVRVVTDGQRIAGTRVHPAGVFEARVPESTTSYRLEADYGQAERPYTFTFDDPYRAWPTVGDLDLHLFGQGRHYRLWEVLGAHPRQHEGIVGVAFAVWAPNAKAVRVVGDWNFWDGRIHPMRSLGGSGVWELFIPGVLPGARYKYELIASDGRLILKADPFAFATEVPPGTASVIAPPSKHEWGDQSWMSDRAATEALTRPMATYEMHLGSWRWVEDGHTGWRPMTYRELADSVPDYLADLGFTHVELMPVAEHPYGGSWGYQVSAYYAPTARYGSPDDFRFFVDALHRKGIGVIVDWVPAHFPRDEFALARFDGTALYEHEDPRKGSQPDWGTLVFNFGRNEVRNFMVANALYWLEELHVDGLRVDAVASMLYLDYSRKEGEWVPNQFGGRENLEAVAFLKEFNETVYAHHPGAMTIAEESTAWPGVSRPTYLGGLGFGFKWNMGWMHDTLEYFQNDPIFRRYHHNSLTFGLVYAWQENFVLPLSHDEVVHGKGSLLGKMPGDRWQKLANLRALLAWMWAHPGKELLFMGAELAQEREWTHERSLDWYLLHDPAHLGVQELVRSLNRVYREHRALWTRDFTPDGFRWIDASDTDNSVFSFLRFAPGVQQTLWPPLPPASAGAVASGPAIAAPPAPAAPTRPELVACVANLTPVPHHGYRIGLPVGGHWRELLNTDAGTYGGSGLGNAGEVWAEDEPWHGLAHSAQVTLPPLAVIWLAPAD